VDGVGNRTSQTVGSATTSFTYNTDDELTATSSSSGGFVNSYSYNNAGDQTGRTLSGTAYTLAYDYEGRLTSTVTGGVTQSSFVYDGLGRRYSRTNGGTTTRFLYDGGKVLEEKQGSSFTAAYAYGNALIRKDGEYPLFDGLGSERTVTNSSQTTTGTIILEGFGLTVATTGSSTNPYKFAATSGYRDDGDAGLSHVGARYYDAQVGRFITRDTELDQHPYLYCDHDPVNAVDPSGHDPDQIDLGSLAGGTPSIEPFVPTKPFPGGGSGGKGGGIQKGVPFFVRLEAGDDLTFVVQPPYDTGIPGKPGTIQFGGVIHIRPDPNLTITFQGGTGASTKIGLGFRLLF
jgi:RHS repeat-associated protein